MPSGYYDLYAEAGSLFVIKLNFLDSNGESANLAYKNNNSYYLAEELKAIGWTHVNNIQAVLQVRKKPIGTGIPGTALLTFSTIEADGILGKIQFVDASIDDTTGEPKSDHNMRIWITDPNAETGTHFYDLELEFIGGTSPTAADPIKLRILQGRFTITPQVTT